MRKEKVEFSILLFVRYFTSKELSELVPIRRGILFLSVILKQEKRNYLSKAKRKANQSVWNAFLVKIINKKVEKCAFPNFIPYRPVVTGGRRASLRKEGNRETDASNNPKRAVEYTRSPNIVFLKKGIPAA